MARAREKDSDYATTPDPSFDILCECRRQPHEEAGLLPSIWVSGLARDPDQFPRLRDASSPHMVRVMCVCVCVMYVESSDKS